MKNFWKNWDGIEWGLSICMVICVVLLVAIIAVCIFSPSEESTIDQSCSITVNHTEDRYFESTRLICVKVCTIYPVTKVEQRRYLTCLNGSVYKYTDKTVDV
jgi:hypothetical protein